MDWQTQLQQLGIVGLAGLLGGIVGLEREFSNKPAGLRTHCFVAAAAALLIVLGEHLLNNFVTENPDTVINSDPLRLIQAIIIGISFLGTGTIVREKNDSVEGLTTAASILLTAAVGIAVATGNYVLAVGASVAAVIVLVAFGWINARIERFRQRRV